MQVFLRACGVVCHALYCRYQDGDGRRSARCVPTQGPESVDRNGCISGRKVVKRICFSFAGLTFQMDCHDPDTAHLVSNNFGSNGMSFTRAAAYAARKTGDEFVLETAGD